MDPDWELFFFFNIILCLNKVMASALEMKIRMNESIPHCSPVLTGTGRQALFVLLDTPTESLGAVQGHELWVSA